MLTRKRERESEREREREVGGETCTLRPFNAFSYSITEAIVAYDRNMYLFLYLSVLYFVCLTMQYLLDWLVARVDFVLIFEK
jgi:dolichyl-phosphate-mannose--protein O-mannosyl transferase